MTPTPTPSATGPTDYERELARIEHDIAELHNATPDDVEAATKLAYRSYQRAALTGAGFERAERSLADALDRFGPAQDLCLLAASLHLRSHRIAEARRALSRADGLAASVHGRMATADLDLQEGRIDEARQACEELVAADPMWDALARLAHVDATLGRFDQAQRRYAMAEEGLTAKEMRSYAWVRLQRGDVDLARGRYDAALAHYERADRAYSGSWLVTERRAQLLAARGRHEDAIVLYRRVHDRVPKPELSQAIGTLYARTGHADLPRAWHDGALAAYLDSAGRGEVQYYHHLAEFYADVRPDAAQAVRWASADRELRRNPATDAALAWAVHLDGRHGEALDLMRTALSSGFTDAHMFLRAAAIATAAGCHGDADHLRRRAYAVNPHVST